MFSKPDTTSFKLGPTKVTIGVFSEADENYQRTSTSKYALCDAIESFLHELLWTYAFIFYIEDYNDFKG